MLYSLDASGERPGEDGDDTNWSDGCSARAPLGTPGHPIKMGDNPIGAIGVSGAPGGQFDDDGARAAIATIQDRMK